VYVWYPPFQGISEEYTSKKLKSIDFTFLQDQYYYSESSLSIHSPMNLHEFELRTMCYAWLSTIYDLWWTKDEILLLVKKSPRWQLTKPLLETSVEELWELTRDTYTTYKKNILQKNKDTVCDTKTLDVYIERLEYEFKVIDAMWYNTYFLIVADYINRSKDNNIVVWPWRGSCAWSLLSFVMGITDLDPLAYDLIFERFLNPWRISMPDIDTDFEDTQRDRVIEYIREKYGEENVAHIWTYMTMAAKAAFKDIARVYGVNFEQSNKVSAMITEKTIKKSLEANKDLKQVKENDQRIKNVLNIAERMEWTIRQTGVHACGMIIAPEPTTTYTVIQHPPASGKKDTRDAWRIVSQFDWGTIEEIGLLKMDLLGLRNLSIIKNTIKIICAKAKSEQEEIHPIFKEFNETMLFHPPMNDEYSFKSIFHKWNTSGVFQFESDGMKTWLKKLRPTHFDDLIAMVSLYRPGPMEYIPHYIDRKYGIEKVVYMEQELRRVLASTYSEEVADEEKAKLLEDLSPFMDITYGIPVYQEQLMRIVQAMAWFSMVEADKLRKWVGKKIKEVIEIIKKQFITKSEEHRWYKRETAVWIYEKMIEPAADYSFNKSHAACYAYISYQTAWLKARYGQAFHAALLRSVEEDTDKLAKFIDEVKLQWYDIRLPHINTSFVHVAAIEDHIELWFNSIKWIWSDIAQAIQDERSQHGVFVDLKDFFKRCSSSINKKSLEALIKSGALDEYEQRSTLLANTQRILDRIKWSEQQAAAWWGLFAMEAIEWADLQLEQLPAYPLMEQLQQEFTVFKTLLSAHPFDGLYNYFRGKYTFISMMKDVEGFGEYTVMAMIKSISRWMRWWFFMVVEDISWETEFYMHEKLDLQVFDIVNIKWYKWHRSPKIDMIIVHDISSIQKKASLADNYKPKQTVARIRQERFSNDAPPAPKITDPEVEIVWEKNIASQKQNSKNIDSKKPITSNKEDKKYTTTFPAPDDMLSLAKLPALIKQHPWDIEITIGTTTAMVDDEGIRKIDKLLHS